MRIPVTYATGKLAFRKATASNPSGNCVEVATADQLVALRHSRMPGMALVFTPAEFAAFVAGAKAGEFDELVQS